MLRSMQRRISHWRDKAWLGGSSPWTERPRSKWHRWLLRLYDTLLRVCQGNCWWYTCLSLSTSPTSCDRCSLLQVQADYYIDIKRQATQPEERSDQRWMLRRHQQIPHHRLWRHSWLRGRRIRRTSWPRACQTWCRCQSSVSPERVPRQQSLSIRVYLARSLLWLRPQSNWAASVRRNHELWFLHCL